MLSSAYSTLFEMFCDQLLTYYRLVRSVSAFISRTEKRPSGEIVGLSGVGQGLGALSGF